MCPSPTQRSTQSPCHVSHHSPIGALSPAIVSTLKYDSHAKVASKEALNVTVSDRETHFRAYDRLLAFYASADHFTAIRALHDKFAVIDRAEHQKILLLSRTHYQLVQRAWLKNLEAFQQQQQALAQAMLAEKCQRLRLLKQRAEYDVQQQWAAITVQHRVEARPSWWSKRGYALGRVFGKSSKIGSSSHAELQQQYQALAAVLSPKILVPTVIVGEIVKPSRFTRFKRWFTKKPSPQRSAVVIAEPVLESSVATPARPELSVSVNALLSVLSVKIDASMAQRLENARELTAVTEQLAAWKLQQASVSFFRRVWRSCRSLALETRLTRRLVVLKQQRSEQKTTCHRLQQERCFRTGVHEFNAVLTEQEQPERQAYFAAKCLAVLCQANDKQTGLRRNATQDWLEDEGALLKKIHTVLVNAQSLIAAPRVNSVELNYQTQVHKTTSWHERQQAERNFCDSYSLAYQNSRLKKADSVSFDAVVNAQLAIQCVLKPYQQSLHLAKMPFFTGAQEYHWQLLMQAKANFLMAKKEGRSYEGRYFASVHDLYAASYGALQAEKIMADIDVQRQEEITLHAQRALTNQQLFNLNLLWNQLDCRLNDHGTAAVMSDPISAFQAIVVPALKPVDVMLQHYLQQSIDDCHKATKPQDKKNALLVMLFRQKNLKISLSEQQEHSIQTLREAFPDLLALPYNALKAELLLIHSKEIITKAQLEQKMVGMWEAELGCDHESLSTVPTNALMLAATHLHHVLANLPALHSLSPAMLPAITQKLILERALLLRIRLLLAQQQVTHYLATLINHKGGHNRRDTTLVANIHASDESAAQLVVFSDFITKHGSSEAQRTAKALQSGQSGSLAAGQVTGSVHESHAYNILIRAIGQFVLALSRYNPNNNKARLLTIKKLLPQCQSVTSQIEQLAHDHVLDATTVMQKKLDLFGELIAAVEHELLSISKEYSFFNPSSSVLFCVLSTQALLLAQAKDNYHVRDSAKKTTQLSLVRLMATLKKFSHTFCPATTNANEATKTDAYHCLSNFEQAFKQDVDWLITHYQDVSDELKILRASLWDYFNHWKRRSNVLHAMHHGSAVADEKALIEVARQKDSLVQTLLSFCWLLKQLHNKDALFFSDIEQAVSEFLEQQSRLFDNTLLPEMTSNGEIFTGSRVEAADNNLTREQRIIQNSVTVLTYMTHKAASVFQALGRFPEPPVPVTIVTAADLRLRAVKSIFIWRGATACVLPQEQCSRFSSLEAFVNLSPALVGFNKVLFLNKQRHCDRSEFQASLVAESLTDHYRHRVSDWLFRAATLSPHFSKQWLDTLFSGQEAGLLEKNLADPSLENPLFVKKLFQAITLMRAKFPADLPMALKDALQCIQVELTVLNTLLLSADPKLPTQMAAASPVSKSANKHLQVNQAVIERAENTSFQGAMANKKRFILALFAGVAVADVDSSRTLANCALGHLKGLLGKVTASVGIFQDADFSEQLFSCFEVLATVERYELLTFIRDHAIVNELVLGLKRVAKESSPSLDRWLAIVNCLHSVKMCQDLQVQVLLADGDKAYSYSTVAVRGKAAAEGLKQLKLARLPALSQLTAITQLYLNKAIFYKEQFHFLAHLKHLKGQLTACIAPLFSYPHFNHLQPLFMAGDSRGLVAVARLWQEKNSSDERKKAFKLLTVVEIMDKITMIQGLLAKPLVEITIEQIGREIAFLPVFIKKQQAALATQVNLGRLVPGVFAQCLRRASEHCKRLTASIYSDGQVSVLTEGAIRYFEAMIDKLDRRYRVKKAGRPDAEFEQAWLDDFEQLFLAYHLGLNPDSLPLKLKTERVEQGFSTLFTLIATEHQAQIHKRLLDLTAEQAQQQDREATELLLSYVHQPKLKQSIESIMPSYRYS